MVENFLFPFYCGLVVVSLQHKPLVVWVMLVMLGLFLMESENKNRALILAMNFPFCYHIRYILEGGAVIVQNYIIGYV